MPPVAIALIIVLAVHYFLAIFTIYLLFQDRGLEKPIIASNLVILLIPIAGPAAYLIRRLFYKK